MSHEGREDPQVRRATLAMAALATIALEQATLQPGRSRGLSLAQTAGLLIIPAIVAAWALAKRHGVVGPRPTGLANSFASPGPGIALVTLFAVPFAWEACRMVVAGEAAMPEVTLMAALRNLGLGLAAMSHGRAYARLSVLVSLFLVTVASSVGGEGGGAVLAPIGGFGVVGTIWLILVYWQGLGLGSNGARRVPISGVAWALGIVAVLAATAAIGPSRAAIALAGLVPTSGGTDWNNPDALSGVGDGDNEVSASEHPQSVGFTDSEIYLETDRPSLYDAFNETYGEPIKPKKQEKMIALGPQDVIEQKDRPAENLHAGREFSAVRRKPGSARPKPAERSAKALVYIKGPTPAHLPLTAYSHFDGVTWREEPCCIRHFPAEQEPWGSWLRLPTFDAPCFAGTAVHQIKIGTLESSPIPVPPHLVRFRVGSVNRLDFFGWAQLGIVRMTDRTVPAGTVIDSETRTVDAAVLRSTQFTPRPGNEFDHFLSFVDEYAISPAVAALARRVVVGVPEGWCQVEAVIAALRSGYALNRLATLPPVCTDVVADFLLRSREGPDYLFASSAVVLLRSLGYPARVISGLYAAPERYDPATRHTPVTAQDVHFWAEVRLTNGLWIAIEPTPGYELMPPIRPWSERIAHALAVAVSWVRSRAAGLMTFGLALVLIVVRRRFLLDRLGTFAFVMLASHDSRRLVLRALSLIERRANWAGRPRPPGLTLARWYLPVARDARNDHREVLEALVRLADWATHAPDRPGLSAPADRHEIDRMCRRAVQAWTLARFRDPVPIRP